MITNNTKRPSRRFLPFLVLILLLGTLTFACSDLGQGTAAPAEEALTETVEGPVSQALHREGGFYADTDELNASMKTYLEDIYKNIRYPAAARASGTTGKFRASLRLGKDGKIETLNVGPFTDELAGGPPMSPEIVIIGYSLEKKDGPKVPELLAEEINHTLSELDNFQPILIKGRPARQTLNIDFNFKLEE